MFTWLPGLLQAVRYSIALVLFLWLLELIFGFHVPALAIVAIMAIVSTAYPILFPLLPGERFAVKGLWLAAVMAIGLGMLGATGQTTGFGTLTAILFTFATALFFAQLYTGNSAVSNYTRVRLEIARFLPIYVVLYLVSFVSFIVQGVVTL